MKHAVYFCLLGFIFVLIGCKSPIFVKEAFRSPQFNQRLESQRIGVLVASNGELNGFEKAFDGLYGSTYGFLDTLRPQVLAAIQMEYPSSQLVPLDRSFEKALVAELDFEKSQVNQVSATFQEQLGAICKQNGIDILVFVSKWSIGKRLRTHERPAFEWEFSPTGRTQSSVKVCDAFLTGGLIDSQGNLIYLGETRGQDDVVLFEFKGTLKKAVAKAVEKFAEMTSGQILDKNIEKIQ